MTHDMTECLFTHPQEKVSVTSKHANKHENHVFTAVATFGILFALNYMSQYTAYPVRKQRGRYMIHGQIEMVNRKALTGSYLSFRAWDDDYLIDVNHIARIVSFLAMYRLSDTAYEAVLTSGKSDKRIPLIHLGVIIGAPCQIVSETTSIIIVDYDCNNTITSLGIVVDSVSAVIDVYDWNVEEKPRFTSSPDHKFVDCYVNLRGRIKKILDVRKLISLCSAERRVIPPPDSYVGLMLSEVGVTSNESY